MKLLAIDSTGQPVSAAITDNGSILGEFYLHTQKKHATTLMPLIDSLFKFTNTCLSDMDGIAISAGPGSFTGIRIGAACAQGLAFAANIPLYAVLSLDSLLFNLEGVNNRCAIMDARRGEVYAKAKCGSAILIETGAMPLSELLKRLGDGRSFTFCGDATLAYRDQILSELPNSRFAAGASLLQHASSAAFCAYAGCCTKSAFDGLKINYVRDSGAQRKKDRNKPEVDA